MGLAATQARYLSLTARKTNIEFEGQQVNQARTALANESANLYNKLYSIINYHLYIFYNPFLIKYYFKL